METLQGIMGALLLQHTSYIWVSHPSIPPYIMLDRHFVLYKQKPDTCSEAFNKLDY